MFDVCITNNTHVDKANTQFVYAPWVGMDSKCAPWWIKILWCSYDLLSLPEYTKLLRQIFRSCLHFPLNKGHFRHGDVYWGLQDSRPWYYCHWEPPPPPPTTAHLSTWQILLSIPLPPPCYRNTTSNSIVISLSTPLSSFLPWFAYSEAPGSCPELWPAWRSSPSPWQPAVPAAWLLLGCSSASLPATPTRNKKYNRAK